MSVTLSMATAAGVRRGEVERPGVHPLGDVLYQATNLLRRTIHNLGIAIRLDLPRRLL